MTDSLSIVIPTNGRHELVTALLDSIHTDAKNADLNIEVILVDDSNGTVADQMMQIAAAHNATVIHGVSQVGEKRNAGVMKANHDLILFLDSDVKIRPGTLRAHVNRLSREPENVAGCLGKVIFVGQPTYAWQVIESMQLPLPFSEYPELADYVTWGPTANLCVRRKQFLQVRGFDTTLPRYGGEDVDLGFRLNNQGLRIATAPDAVAEHAIETWGTWYQNLRRLWSFGLADYYLLIRHPDRCFYDFPTGPMLWLVQTLVLLVLIARQSITPIAAVCAIGVSVAAYHLVYALIKREAGSRLRVHLLGPFVFWIMDFAKAFESLRHGRPAFVFQRIKFHDDSIALDWKEIAASAWGITASSILYLAVILLAKILANHVG
ncbi:MAG: glycosyltransferase [Phycisphaerales bacterium]|nr:glycosyltransferase [Phycisphaerales bacterium]